MKYYIFHLRYDRPQTLPRNIADSDTTHLTYFNSYLTDLKCRNWWCLSNISKLKVPQGTMLGYNLFTIYMIGLFSTKHRCEILSFTHDTFFHQENTKKKLKRIFEHDFLMISNWDDHMLIWKKKLFNACLLACELKRKLEIINRIKILSWEHRAIIAHWGMRQKQKSYFLFPLMNHTITKPEVSSLCSNLLIP